MKIQKDSSSKTNPNLGEAIPMPSQAHLVQKAEPLRCLALRTRTGRTCNISCNYPVLCILPQVYCVVSAFKLGTIYT